MRTTIGKPSKKSIDDTLEQAFQDKNKEELATEFNKHFVESVTSLCRQGRKMANATAVASSINSAYMPSLSRNYGMC